MKKNDLSFCMKLGGFLNVCLRQALSRRHYYRLPIYLAQSVVSLT